MTSPPFRVGGAPQGSAAPIGVFDSGIGGLTVVRELMRRLPRESLIYVGDTARVPYGPKSPETVSRYALQIGQWLVDQGAKAVVIACNTATAHALPLLTASLSVPVIGVIEPGARAAARASSGQPIGVIGTAGTIASGAYERAIHNVDPLAVVRAVPCPLFVPLVEEGWLDHPATHLIVEQYLSPLRESHVATLVLGCTHYPLIADAIQRAVGDNVQLIDSAAETGNETMRVLADANLLSESGEPSTLRFVASDAPDRFLMLGRRFLGDVIDHVDHVTFT